MAEKEVKKISIGLILSWLFGLLFVFGAIGQTIDGNILTGIFFFLAGAIILPPVDKQMKEKYGIELSKWVKIIIFVLLISIGSYFSPVSETTSTPKTTTTTPTSTQETIPSHS